MAETMIPATESLRKTWKKVIVRGVEHPIVHVVYAWPNYPTYRVTYTEHGQLRGALFNCETREWVGR